MNPLVDIIPAAARRYLYAAYALACLVAGAMHVGGVDVGAAPEVLAYLGIGIGATAASNTKAATNERGAVDLGTALIFVVLVLLVLLLAGVIR